MNFIYNIYIISDTFVKIVIDYQLGRFRLTRAQHSHVTQRVWPIGPRLNPSAVQVGWSSTQSEFTSHVTQRVWPVGPRFKPRIVRAGQILSSSKTLHTIKKIDRTSLYNAGSI